MEFISHLKEFREKAGMTQQDLASRVSVRRETIVFLEQGKYIPSLKLAYQIAQVFKVKIEKIFEFGIEGEVYF